MIRKFVNWVIRKSFENQKLRKTIEPTIKSLFWEMVKTNRQEHADILKKEYVNLSREEFVIKHEITPVKKGKRRYDLLAIEDKNGIRRVQISRHLEELHSNKMEIPVN